MGSSVKLWGATWLARLHVRIRRWLLPKLHHNICPMRSYEYIRMVELFQHRHPCVYGGRSSWCLCPKDGGSRT